MIEGFLWQSKRRTDQACICFALRVRNYPTSTPLGPTPMYSLCTALTRQSKQHSSLSSTHRSRQRHLPDTSNAQHPCICFACVKTIQPSFLVISLCCPSPNASARGIQRPKPNSHVFALLCVCKNHPAVAPLCSFPFLRHHHLNSSQRQPECIPNERHHNPT